MEPSAPQNNHSNTSDDAHELHNLSPPPATETPASRERSTERRRVRILSSAAEIPHSHLRESVSNTSHQSAAQSAEDYKHGDEAEELLKAHRTGTADRAGEKHVEKQPSHGEEDSDDGHVASGNHAHGGPHGGIQGGIFYQLLQAYKAPTPPMGDAWSDGSLTPPPHNNKSTSQPGSSSGTGTPRRKWYEQDKDMHSQETLSTLIGASAKLAGPAQPDITEKKAPDPRRHHKRNSSNPILNMMWKAKEEQDAKIKVHVADLLKRQRYIIKMCRALMLYGAPTHRLEEYLATTAKVLDMNCQFLYIPGCMIISFDDVMTHTAEVKIVRAAQGVNLGKLKDVHSIYKEVLHDVISLDEALERLDTIMNAKIQHPVWLNVIMYGLASTAVSTFFSARFIDMPVIFALGCMLGFLQLVVAPKSNTYGTVFEVSATIVMSFVSRALGSIRGGDLFCFSALAQSSIAMILPGWLVLSSALELQSKAIVPGSIRLVYAIIYSLFLGYGITVGTALYGAIDSNAVNTSTCQDPLNPYWNFLFVPLYVFFATFTVQAKYKQMPVMIFVALCGYIVNFFSNKKFTASAPIAYTFGAFAIGVLANLYSRLRHGVAATVLLPAVYVQVPGSLASSGSISTALSTASSLLKSTMDISQPADESTASLNAIVFNVAASMIQIAIGITVGLFMSALVIYPLGKRRSGLWTL